MRSAPGIFALLLLGAACKKSPPPPAPEVAAHPPAAVPSAVPVPARCKPVSEEPAFVLGPPGAANARADSGESGRTDSLPFAAEVGDGVAFATGFAVGAVHESGSALSMSVVTLDADGHNVKVIPLGTARGDVEPPRVVAHMTMLAVAVLEPDVNGRSLRLAKVENGAVTWGAALHKKPGESQAFDVALGEKKGIVVWDDEGDSAGIVQVSTFDASTLQNATPPRTISRASADAESPRLSARQGGGYWLTYIARADRGDFDAHYTAEDIGFRWIEAVSLDANGSPTGAARAVTPKDGHVMVFDVAPAPEGALLLAYRNDDTPTGSAGGEVMRVIVRPSSIDPPSVLVQEGVGAGAPNLLPGWIAVLDAADTTRLAPLSALGEVMAPFSAEPDIGPGEPIAGSADRLLVARPAGRAIKLVVLRCNAERSAGNP